MHLFVKGAKTFSGTSVRLKSPTVFSRKSFSLSKLAQRWPSSTSLPSCTYCMPVFYVIYLLFWRCMLLSHANLFRVKKKCVKRLYSQKLKQIFFQTNNSSEFSYMSSHLALSVYFKCVEHSLLLLAICLKDWFWFYVSPKIENGKLRCNFYKKRFHLLLQFSKSGNLNTVTANL